MLTPDQVQLRSLAHDFAEGEIRPQTAGWDGAMALSDDIFEKLGEADRTSAQGILLRQRYRVAGAAGR